MERCSIPPVDQWMDEAHAMVNGLHQVQFERDRNTSDIVASEEDIHSANERKLTEIKGAEVGGKLLTVWAICILRGDRWTQSQCRNDQVATDARLWLRGPVHANITETNRRDSLICSLRKSFNSPIGY
jgi:argininosuccinate lyase